MAKDGKTEKATPQRRRKARAEGQVARSAELSMAASLLAAILAARIFLPSSISTLRGETRTVFSTLDPDRVPFDRLTSSGLRMVLGALAPFAGAAVAAALVAGFSQVGMKLSPKAARPKLSNLSPKKGLERLKPSVAGWELARTALKLALLLVVVWGPITTLSEHIRDVRSLDGGLGLLGSVVWTMLVRATIVAAVIGAADYAYNHRRTENMLKMSKHEIRQEHKEQEGDPMVKAQRRRRAQELARSRMLRDVATADVVLINPTELAIALRYEAGSPAPRVVAKGADHLAAKIRKEARRHGVPITADKPLCRAIYKRCKVGDYIPNALFEAVAIVLAWAYRRTGRVPGDRSVA